MDCVVKFEDVYKEYPFYHHMTAGFKSFLFHLPRNIASLRRTKFAALKGVSFAVARGETFGIIGRNGSGKSTLLGLIAGVIRQDRGSVRISGKISSLLELGAGFHPDLSGIENIILNGILMGNTREEMLKKIDEIIEFSELGEFIYQPLRTYSSGMHVRLGFAVAVHVDPEILVIDEALAVGDMNFQEKCLRKMSEFRRSGATIIIVSHDMASIAKLCDRAAWLAAGEVMAVGKPKDVITKYLRHSGQEDRLTPEEKSLLGIRDPGEGIPAGAASGPALPEPIHDEVAGTEDHGGQEALAAGSPPSPLSWWESPEVLWQCEVLITGDPSVYVYDLLKRNFLHETFGKGLIICNEWKWLEDKLIMNDICRSFDTLPAGVIAGAPLHASGAQGNYDIFVCVDFLNRLKDPSIFMKDLSGVLKKEGFILAVEYIGPANYQWTHRERDIADMIYAAVCNNGASGDTEGGVSPRSTDRLRAGAASSDKVISSIKGFFDILAIQYFGGPLFGLLIDRILDRLDLSNNKKDLALIRAIIKFEQVLIREGVLENNYALILGKRKAGLDERGPETDR